MRFKMHAVFAAIALSGFACVADTLPITITSNFDYQNGLATSAVGNTEFKFCSPTENPVGGFGFQTAFYTFTYTPPFPPIPIQVQAHARILLAFSLQQLPAFAEIQSATLTLNVLPPNGPTQGMNLLHVPSMQCGGCSQAAGDYQVSGNLIPLALNIDPPAGPYPVDVTAQVVADRNAGRPCSAFRGEFAAPPSGTARGPNLGYAEMGQAATLTIEYTVAPVAFIITGSPVAVPEGGTAFFQARLSANPQGTVAATAQRTGGDSDLSVITPMPLLFNSSNWSQPQNVTIAAAADADFLNSPATFSVSAAGLPDGSAAATEIDDEAAPARIYVNAAASGANTGESWANALTSLQDGLLGARFSGGAVSEIWVARGIYRPGTSRNATFELVSGATVYGGFAGGETSLGQRNIVANETILSGDLLSDDGPNFSNSADNAYHVARCASGICVIDGVIVEAGNADGVGIDEEGGGLRIEPGAHAELFDCSFRRCQAWFGGGIFNGGFLAARRCAFLANRAQTYGGGLHNDFTTTALIDRCLFQGNRVDGTQVLQRGGGLFNQQNSNVTVLNSRFFGNLATRRDPNLGSSYGGGAFNENCSPLYANCVFSGNSAHDDGGAVHNLASTQNTAPRFDNCTIIHNSALGTSGGIASIGLPNPFLPLVCESAPIFECNPIFTHCLAWANHDVDGADADSQIRTCWGTPTFVRSLVQRRLDNPFPTNDPRVAPDGHLLADSPCIDAGQSAFTPAAGAEIEIDGDPRIGNAVVDIGADEFQDSDGNRLPDWVESAYGGPAADPDGDGATNLEEYELFGTHPQRMPVHVSPAGDDAWDGAAATHQGGTIGPKRTIQAGIDAATDADTVLLGNGTYSGPGNVNLVIADKAILLRGAGGPTQAIIDGAAAAGGVLIESGASPRTTIANLTIANTTTIPGQSGGLEVRSHSAAQVWGCEFLTRPNAQRADGLNVRQATLRAGDLALVGDGTGDAPHWFPRSSLELAGDLHVRGDELRLDATEVFGRGTLWIDQGGLVSVQLGQYRSSLRSNLSSSAASPGNLLIQGAGTLAVEGNAIVNMGGENGGAITVYGTLIAREQCQIRNSNINVNLLNVTTDQIFNNDIRLIETSGFGGEFFVEGNAGIIGNRIIAEGDRYLDFDPDPDDAQNFTFSGNTIKILIREGAQGSQGTLLELRSRDYDHAVVSPGNSGAFALQASDGYQDPWVIEELEVTGDSGALADEGAKVNLTNRDGFVFAQPTPEFPADEAMYVKRLTLHPGAVLNTGHQRLYYQTLVGIDDSGAEIPLTRDPNQPFAPLENRSRFQDVPILGFSLINIDMENQLEFDVRVRSRERTDMTLDPELASTPRGTIERTTDPEFGGVMRMATARANHPPVANVAAKGSFARCAEEIVTVKFRYRFAANPAGDASVQVSLSDQTRVSQGLVPVATLRPPPANAPGGVGSSEFARFAMRVPRNTLNFTRGTYIELTLAGTNAEFQVDDWDPEIHCTGDCFGFDGDADVGDEYDLLYLMGIAGQTLDSPGIQSRGCVDHALSLDGHIDLQDLLLWDTNFYDPVLTFCDDGLRSCTWSRGPADPVEVPADALAIAGKESSLLSIPQGYPVNTRLYFADANQNCSLPSQPPASTPGNSGYHGDGRFARDLNNDIHQLHGLYGLVRLRDGAVRLTPESLSFSSAEMVRVGMEIVDPDGDCVPQGLMLTDADFSSRQLDEIYVAPVLVIADNVGCPVGDAGGPMTQFYRAAAKLRLTNSTPSFEVVELYGTNPWCDPRRNATPPELSSIDVQHIREIEVDEFDNVFVLASELGGNDWLLVYPAANRIEQAYRLSGPEFFPPDQTDPGADGVSALQISRSHTGANNEEFLFFSRSRNEPGTHRTRLFRCRAQRDASGSITGVSPAGSWMVDGVDQIVSIVERRQATPPTEMLWLVGYSTPPPPPLDNVGSSLQSSPRLALLSPTAPTGGTIASLSWSCADMAFPMDAIFTAPDGLPCLGDLDGSGQVDLSDLTRLLSHFGQTNVPPADGDLNGDQVVALADLSLMLSRFGQACP